jgi:hypothetical protein
MTTFESETILRLIMSYLIYRNVCLQAVYDYLALFLPCTKDTLLKRAKNLFMQEQVSTFFKCMHVCRYYGSSKANPIIAINIVEILLFLNGSAQTKLGILIGSLI